MIEIRDAIIPFLLSKKDTYFEKYSVIVNFHYIR